MNDGRIEQVDIRPEVNILGVLRHLNYKPWYALAEFVDNALASALKSGSSLNDETPFVLSVNIDIDLAGPGTVTIRDNAFGISLQDFPRAFRAAELPPDQSGLSEFGMGMKSAASWFAKRWSVHTSVLGEDVERSVSFDLEKIVADRSHQIPITEIPALEESHYTEIVLSGLNHRPQGRTLAKIKDHLRSMYRTFLRSGSFELRINDDLLEYKEVPVLTAAPAWEPGAADVVWIRDDIDIRLSGDRRVTGFVGLRATGSTSEAGFALFRRGRLIVGSHDETYRPEAIFGRSNSYVFQRLFGELDLHGFEVSHTKDGFQWGDHETEFMAALRGVLREQSFDLIRQANEYRAKLPTADEREPIRQATSFVAREMQRKLAPVLTSLTAEPLEEIPILDELDTEAEPASRKVIKIETQDGPWQISLSSKIDVSSSKWLEVASFEGTQMLFGGRPTTLLEVSVNFAHPFSRRFAGASGENSNLLMTFAAALSVALALGKSGGARSSYILKFLNDVLRGSFTIDKVEG